MTNTGNHEGKEVLQLYGSAPEGALDKPAKILLAYAKTKLLQPGENQLVTLTANVNDLASYDDLGVLYKSAYVMDRVTVLQEALQSCHLRACALEVMSVLSTLSAALPLL